MFSAGERQVYLIFLSFCGGAAGGVLKLILELNLYDKRKHDRLVNGLFSRFLKPG